MALFGKNNGETENTNGKAKAPTGPEAHNHIGQGTTVKGTLKAPGLLRVDGAIEGEVHCQAKAVFGTESTLKGELTAQTAEIAGKINGTVVVEDLLVLKSTAVLEGKVYYGTIQADKGAIIRGEIQEYKDMPGKSQRSPMQESPKEKAAEG